MCPVELRDQQLHEAVLVRCRGERIEPRGRLDRIIGSARAVFEQRFRAWARANGITVPDRGRLRPEIHQAWRDALT